MSVTQLSKYLLWKSLKHKTTLRFNETLNIKEEISQNKEEIFENMICRVCTNPAEVPITDKFDGTLILSAIRIVANISINESDNYPKYVCKMCLGELKIAFQFKKKCEASDLMFRKAISSETTIVTNSQPVVLHDFSLILHQMKQKRLTRTVIKHDNDDDNDYNDDLTDHSNKCLGTPDKEFTVSLPVKREEYSPVNDIINHNHTVDIFDDSKNCNIANNKLNTTDDKYVRIKIKKIKKLRRLHKCRRCDLKFDTQEEFEKHRKNNGCVYHPCPQCGKLVLKLSSHEKLVHSRTDKHTCYQCGKIYYSSASLNNHMHTHKETKEYFCEHCPYRGKRKSYLVCHMRVHTGEHRYLCSMCPLKFTNPSNLSKHQLIHFNKKFECSKCNRQFRQERYLKEHFDAAHLNIRYRCSICGKDLISRKKLLTHEIRVHKREKHKLFEEVQRIVVGNDHG